MSGSSYTATYTSYEGNDGKPLTKQQLVKYFKSTEQEALGKLKKVQGVYDKPLPELRPMKHESAKFSQNDLNKALSEYKIKTLDPKSRLQQFPLSFDFVPLATSEEWTPEMFAGNYEQFSYVRQKNGQPKLSITWKTDWTNDEAILGKFAAGMPIFDSKTGVVPTYTPVYKVVKYDADFVAAFRGKLLSGAFTDYEIDNAVEVYSQMVYAANNFSFNSGTVFGQVGRLAAVEAVALHKKQTTMSLSEYRAIMDKYFALTPLQKTCHWTDDIGKLRETLETGAREGWGAITTNLDADAGLLQSSNGRMFKKAETVVQDSITARMTIQSMGTDLEPKMLDTARLLAMKNKGEIYANSDRKKKTRNIFVTQNGTQIPQMMIYNTAHYDKQTWNPVGLNISLAGFSPWYGGMHNLLLDVIQYVNENNYAFLVYADNLYIAYLPTQGQLGYTPHNTDGGSHLADQTDNSPREEQQDIVWISLDGSKMEAAIDTGLIKLENLRMIERLKESGHTFSDQFVRYSTEFYPTVACEGVAVIGGAQIPLHQMGSGTIGTFAYNNAKMTLMVDAILKYVKQAEEDDIFFKRDFVQSKNGSYEFSPWMKKIMDDQGLQLTVEKVVTHLQDKMTTVGALIDLDLLGFCGYTVKTSINTVRVLPALDPNRFYKTLVMPKSDSFYSQDKIKRFTTRLVRTISLIVLGAWKQPALFKVLRRRVLSEFKALSGAAKLSDLSSEALIDAIKDQLAGFTDDFLKSMFNKLMEDKDNVLMPSIIRMMQLVGFPDPAYIVHIAESVGIQPNLLLSDADSKLMGIKLAPITQVARFKEPVDLSYFVALQPMEVKQPAPLVATDAVPREIYRDTKAKSDPTKVLKISQSLLKIFTKGVIVHFVVPILPRYRYNLDSIRDLPAFIQSAFFSEFANQFGLRRDDLFDVARRISHAVRLHLHYDAVKPPGHKLIGDVIDISGPGEYFFTQFGNYTHDLFIATGSMFHPVLDVKWYEEVGVDWSDLAQYIKGNRPIPIDLESEDAIRKSKHRGQTKAIVREYAWGQVPATNLQLRQKQQIDKAKVDTAQALVPKPKPKPSPSVAQKFSQVPKRPETKQYHKREITEQKGGERDIIPAYRKEVVKTPKDYDKVFEAALADIKNEVAKKDYLTAFRMTDRIPQSMIDKHLGFIQSLATLAHEAAQSRIKNSADLRVKTHYRDDFNSTLGRLNKKLKSGLKEYAIKL